MAASLSGTTTKPGSQPEPPMTVIVDSTGIKSATKKHRCVVFDIDLHLYIDNSKNATVEDIISADMSLMESLMLLGLPVQNFAKHIRFLSDKVKVFNGTSLVKYDRACREKAEMLGPLSFVYGDHEFTHAFLGVENLKPKTKVIAQKGVARRSARQPGYCWKFNDQKGCKNDLCQYRHECKSCGGPQSVHDCNSKK